MSANVASGTLEQARKNADNWRLLQEQNAGLAQEEPWAHATGEPEQGGVLLAGPRMVHTEPVTSRLSCDGCWPGTVGGRRAWARYLGHAIAT